MKSGGGLLIREHWRDPQFWSWWWRQRVPVDAKLFAAFVGISLLAFGGFVAAGGLNSAVTSDSFEPVSTQVLTVQELVTVRGDRTPVTKPVEVVRTVPGRARTSYETQVVLDTVTTPGSRLVVTQRDLRTVPVVRRVVVTRDGRVRTVVRTGPGVTQVRTAVVTDQRTVTQERVLTSERIVTRERVVTDARPVTVRATETIRRTETLPVTIVETIQRTATETVPVTVVETLPVTVTVTVKK